MDERTAEPTVVEEIRIEGFDPTGEPVLQRLSDGTLAIRFEAMPPFFAEEEGTQGDFENFETLMTGEFGIEVIRDDREVFLVRHPRPDTAARIQAWLGAYRRPHE